MFDKTKAISDLTALLGADKVLTSEEAIIGAQSMEYSFERAFGYVYPHPAIAVVKPACTEDVSKILKYCNENGVNVIPKTGGSRGAGSLVPSDDHTITIDGSGLDSYVIDEYNYAAEVGCGMPVARLEEIVRPMGMTTGHFPQSFPLAQYGGLISTRSMGQFSTYFGAIEDMLVGLEVVLADGTVCEIRPVPRRAVGPDLKNVFMGAEGTYGFITKAYIKLFKYRPHADLWKGAYIMPSYLDGMEAIREIMTEGYKPAVARLYDKPDYDYNYGTVELEDGEAYMFFVNDGPEGVQKATGDAIDKIAAKHGARQIGTQAIDHWLEHVDDLCSMADMEATAKVFRETKRQYGAITIAGNWADLQSIYKDVMAEEPGKYENQTLLGGHISHCYHNGANIYFVYEFEIEDPMKATETILKFFEDISLIALRYKSGTIEHHHGIGKERAYLCPQEHGSSYEVLKRIKNVLDPNNIFSPGTLMPIESLK